MGQVISNRARRADCTSDMYLHLRPNGRHPTRHVYRCFDRTFQEQKVHLGRLIAASQKDITVASFKEWGKVHIDIIYYSATKDKNVNINVCLDICARYRINLIKLLDVYFCSHVLFMGFCSHVFFHGVLFTCFIHGVQLHVLFNGSVHIFYS